LSANNREKKVEQQRNTSIGIQARLKTAALRACKRVRVRVCSCGRWKKEGELRLSIAGA
jgi:hypothetical protein